MIIKDVKKVDEGDYTCIAQNKAGEKAEEVSLNVFGKRIIPTPWIIFSLWPFSFILIGLWRLQLFQWQGAGLDSMKLVF